MIRKKVYVIVSAIFSVALAGCSTKAGSGAVIGGLGGAAVGGLIGSKSHSRAGAGAAIGAGVGALGGAVVGHQMDKADEKKRDEGYSSSSSPRYHERGETSTYDTNRITPAKVIDWTRQGVQTDIIVDRIQRSGQNFVVTAADERQMRDAGVAPSVIDAMKNTR